MATLFEEQEINEILISELYHENSKIRRFEIEPETGRAEEQSTEISVSLPVFPNSFRVYPGCEKITLSKDLPETEICFDKLIKGRRSIREFVDKPIPLDDLSKLLYFGSGITGTGEYANDTIQYFRTAPSAGGRYPIEIFPVVANVTGLKKGIYHYNVKEHALEFLKEGDYRQFLYRNCLSQDFLNRAAVIFLLAAIFLRTKAKYGERGYRYVLLDAGHLAENIYLTATALHLGPVAIGGFADDAINELLDCDGVEESVIYIMAIGRI